MNQGLPDPRDVTARKALAALPPAPLERVLRQAEASRRFIAEWRTLGLPDLPIPHHLSPSLKAPTTGSYNVDRERKIPDILPEN
jgi:hypothetical protein